MAPLYRLKKWSLPDNDNGSVRLKISTAEGVKNEVRVGTAKAHRVRFNSVRLVCLLGSLCLN